jgi:tetratricopeptide (TPR) repeat protein
LRAKRTADFSPNNSGRFDIFVENSRFGSILTGNLFQISDEIKLKCTKTINSFSKVGILEGRFRFISSENTIWRIVMYRKSYLIGFLTVALFLIGGVSAFAQTAPVGGRVVLKGADGKMTPVEGALVEVYRTDIKTKFPTDTTDKKGQFNIAGLPLGAVFVLNVSGPGIEPQIIPNIKAGMDRLDIDVKSGDGKRWTEEEVRLALAGASTPTQGETPEQKKAREEFEKNRADIDAKNKKIENQTVMVRKALDEGNAAFNSKNLDLAITKYEEGYQANPEYVGSAPVLLNNKGQALKQRAIETFNANTSNKDANARLEAMKKVRQDLTDAADAYGKSWTIIKAAPAAEVNDPKTNELNKMQALNGARDTFRIMAQTRQVDTTKTEMAKEMIAEFLKVESDQTKKAEAQRILGDIYLAAGDSENAIAEYKKVLDINAADADALAGIGLSIVNLGYLSNDKAKFQEGADYLQRFLDVAPSNHRYVDDAKGLIETLKAEQNVAPQKGKTPTNTRRKN